MDFDIAYVKGLQVLDSRGNPTVEALVITEGGGYGRAIAPAGASKGAWEAVELRDGGKDYGGKGVRKAVDMLNKVVGPAIVGMDSTRYRDVDRKIMELDGTPNFSRIGGNTAVATSLAVIKAAADTEGIPLFEFLGGRRATMLPVPLMNIINGGAHAGNDLSIQEFMIVPVGADTFTEALKIAVEIYAELKKILRDEYGKNAVNVGDEGGFAPPLRKTREALEVLMKAVKGAGYSEGEVHIALDAAAAQFHDPKTGKYLIDGEELKSEELLELYLSIVDEYPIVSIEDPFTEEGGEWFIQLRKALSGKAFVIGDDITVTNLERTKKSVEEGAIDGAIIKVNQIGLFTLAEEVIEYLLQAGRRAIISHRSGESEDATIAHIAVAYRTGLIKTGAPARGERTAKYNELLRIEDYLSGDAEFPGKNVFLR